MQISKEQILSKINSNIKILISEDFYQKQFVDARSLITSERIDIFIKYLYVKSYITNQSIEFYTELYLKHIQLLNHFVEADSSHKVGKHAFLNEFNHLIHQISQNGFDENYLIPVDNDSIPLDGAHRIAISAYLGLSIPIFNIKTIGTHIFNLSFFINRGLDNRLADFICTEFAKFNSSTHAVLIWPKAEKKDQEITELLNQYGTIIHDKKIDLNYNGLVNLMTEVYNRESWLGDYSNDFTGAHNKASQCFTKNNLLRVYFYQPAVQTNLIELKNQIRDIYKIQKHSVHINDTHEETIEITQLLFDLKNIHRLNYSSRKEMPTFNQLFKQFETYLKEHKIEKDSIALIGAVLALYGAKDAKDLDYISTKKMVEKISSEIELETKKLNFTKHNTESLIHNPKFFFYYRGIKFISLEEILTIKKNRNNLNDKFDSEIIHKLLQNKVYSRSFKDRIKTYTSIYYYKRLIKNWLLFIRFILYKYLLKK